MLSSILLFFHLVSAPVQLLVQDSTSGQPVPETQIQISAQNIVAYTNQEGIISLKLSPGNYSVQLYKEGYKKSIQQIQISDTTTRIVLQLPLKEVVSQEVVIRAVRAPRSTPVTQQNISREDIERSYFGHDVPVLLNNSTSINSYSETGNGMGYSYFRMRGIDQTRINYTVNGIPVNDPETQGYYFNNFADLMSSIQSVQIQRGVGTSSNGTASFAGSVNMLGIELDDTASFGFTSGYGSFGSHRLSAEYQTGKISDRFAFYGRVSNLATEGYRDNSAVGVVSYYITGASIGKKSLLKVTSFGGEEHSQLAYFGTPKTILDTNRTYNPLTRFDKDKFRQTFHQLHYTYAFNKNLDLTSAAYFVKGTGYFDVYVPGMPYFLLNLPDSLGSYTNSILRYQLNMNFGGAMSYLTFKNQNVIATVGVHANSFSSRHYMTTPWLQIVPDTFSSDHLVHDNTGFKNEFSTFGKVSYKVSRKLLLYADAQLRHTNFRYEAIDMPIYRDTFSTEGIQWTFLNPKAGFRYSLSPSASIYSSVGKTTREPTRVDMIVDDRALEPIDKNRVKPEQVVDVELGTEIQTGKWKVLANFYAMEFKNEIIATGKLNSFGYAMRENVDESFRRGLELDLTYRVNRNFTILNSSSYSYNRIKSLTQNLPVIDTFGFNTYTTEVFEVKNTQPLMTPSLMVNQGVRYEALGWLSLEVMGKYVSKMYLDNTNTEALTSPAYFYADARASVKLNKWLKKGDYRLSVQWNNFTNTDFYPNGTASHFYQMQSGGSLVRENAPAYYPAAPSNVFVTLDMKF